MSKKIVVKLDLHDNKDKQKAMKAVSVLVGIDSITVDMASRKMTVIGTVDPVNVVSKLRKTWAAKLDSVGPAKEPEKEEKKEEKKEGDGKKEGEAKKEEGGDGKKEGEGKEEGDGKKEGDDKKEGDGKKEEGGEKKEGDGKKEGGGEKKVMPLPMPMLHHLPPQYMNPMITADHYMNQYRPAPPPPAYPYAPPPQYYYVRNMSMEENPNSCAIC